MVRLVARLADRYAARILDRLRGPDVDASLAAVAGRLRRG